MNRKELLQALLSLLLSGVPAGYAFAGDESSGTQSISRAAARTSVSGPSDYFTGTAQIDPLFPSNETAHYSGAYVTFDPGARSAWHVHPAGQHIVVTSGSGRTGVWGGPVEEIGEGDVVWCPPGVKHWHGAAPTSAMTHLVITGYLDGENVVWKEKVTDAQYGASQGAQYD